jgi:hypothetical protein
VFYKQIVEDILMYGGQPTGGEAETLVKNRINGVYYRVMDMVTTPSEEREFTLATVADKSQYGMPLWVKKILNIEDPTTPRVVAETTARAFDKVNPGSTASSVPHSFYVLQTKGTRAMPSTDGTLTVVSDAAGDAGVNYKVRVEGFDTSENLVSELITLNGTTPASSALSYDSVLGVERIVKAPASSITFAGTITLKDNAGNIIATVPLGWDSPDYLWIEFDPIPAGVITYTVRSEMRVPMMVNDFDWPKFETEFHDLLIWGVTQDLLVGWGKPAIAAAHRLTFKERLEELEGTANSAPAAIWVFGNVQSQIQFGQRPQRPLTKGADFGLAS